MPLLPNPKHEKIVQAFVKGKGQLEAYVLVGFKAHAPSASAFFKRAEVQERIKEVRALRSKLAEEREIESSAEAAKKLGITKTKILHALWLNAERCLRGAPILDKEGKQETDENGHLKYTAIPSNPAAANQALKLIGMETFSMFIEKVEVGGPGDFARLTDDELLARLEEDATALGLSPDAAEALMLTFRDEKDNDIP